MMEMDDSLFSAMFFALTEELGRTHDSAGLTMAMATRFPLATVAELEHVFALHNELSDAQVRLSLRDLPLAETA